jgi:hypothetical protein
MRRSEWLLLLSILGILLCLAMPLSGPPGVDAEVSKARLICAGLAMAADEYANHPANPDHRPPGRVGDLFHPPWGGPSLYRHSAEEPLDPWGSPFRMERRKMPNGGEGFVFWTAKPDGTRISQFGVGPSAEPR